MEDSYQRWSNQLERFIMVRLGDPQLAEEIAQEAMIRLIAKQRAGQVILQPRAWLFRAARNLAIDVVRRRLPSPLGLEALAMLPDRRGESEEGELDTRVGEVPRIEVLGWLPQLLSKLSLADQEVLECHYALGMSCQDLAVEKRISVANVKIRLHRARRRLLSAIEQRQRAEEWQG
jgi:RNA polymerase sigma-70 factor (ECF subfamily)